MFDERVDTRSSYLSSESTVGFQRLCVVPNYVKFAFSSLPLIPASRVAPGDGRCQTSHSSELHIVAKAVVPSDLSLVTELNCIDNC